MCFVPRRWIAYKPTGIFNHNALLETNAGALENIEIIRGAYSSLYGSEAIGGSVNFITEKPSKDLEVVIGGRINNIGYYRLDAKASTTINKKTGVYLSAYTSEINNGFRDYGDFYKKTVTTKLNHEFSKKFSIENALTYVDYYSQMSGSIGEEAYRKKDYTSNHTFTYRKAHALRVTSTLNYEWDENNNSFLKFFYRNNSMEQNPTYRIGLNRNDGIIYGELNANDFYSFGALLQHNSQVSDAFKYSAGAIIDYTNNDFIAERLIVNQNSNGIYESFTRTNNFTSDYLAKLLNTGVFTSLEFKLNNVLRINGGLRIDAFRYYFDNNLGANATSFSSPNTKNTFWSVTPRLGLVYNKKTYGAYANYSRGFVPPSVGELYKDAEVPNLDPSVFNNFEIGSFKSFLNNALYFDVALYYLRGENEVITVLTEDESFVNDNAGETQHYGLELMLEYDLSSEFTLKVSQAFSKHRFVDYVEKGISFNGNDMSEAPSCNSSTILTYKPNYLKGFHVGAELQILGSYYTENENLDAFVYKGHEVLNLRAGYKIKQFYVWANLLNVTDELFATSATTRRSERSGVVSYGQTFTPGNPRNLTVGLRYSLN